MIIGISGKISSGKDTVARIVQYLTTHKDIGISWEEFNSHDFDNDFASNWEIKKFAGKLKQCIAIILDIPVEDLEKEEVKNRILGEEWWYYNVRDSVNSSYIKKNYLTHNIEQLHSDWIEVLIIKPTIRQLLQEFGTEVGRAIHPNFWINALFADYKVLIPQWSDHTGDESIYPNWLISDTRFPNEVEAIKSRDGIVIRVNRIPNCPNCGNLDGNTNSDNTWMCKECKIYFKTSNHPSETSLDNYAFDYVIDNNGTIEELIQKVKEILIKEKII